MATMDSNAHAGLPRRNSDSRIDKALASVRDNHDEKCIVAAHPFGSVFLRVNEHGEWKHTRAARTSNGSTRWMTESRIYSARRDTLLAESEVSVVPIHDYPTAQSE